MAAKLPNRDLPWPIDYDEGVAEIARSEGCRLVAYKCPAGKWTCGWGETDGVGPSTRWTQDFADRRLCDSLIYYAQTVRAACTVEPTENQLAALLSFSYNYVGWRTSTVLKCHNRRDFLGAARAFDMVNKYTDPKTGKKVVSSGLTARRKREAALYLKPPEGQEVSSIPQIVEAERPLTASPTAVTSVVAVGAGGVSILGELGSQVGVVSSVTQQARTVVVEHLGFSLDVVPWVLLAAFGGMTLWRRFKNRIEGWL